MDNMRLACPDVNDYFCSVDAICGTIVAWSRTSAAISSQRRSINQLTSSPMVRLSWRAISFILFRNELSTLMPYEMSLPQRTLPDPVLTDSTLSLVYPDT